MKLNIETVIAIIAIAVAVILGMLVEGSFRTRELYIRSGYCQVLEPRGQVIWKKCEVTK